MITDVVLGGEPRPTRRLAPDGVKVFVLEAAKAAGVPRFQQERR